MANGQEVSSCNEEGVDIDSVSTKLGCKLNFDQESEESFECPFSPFCEEADQVALEMDKDVIDLEEEEEEVVLLDIIKKRGNLSMDSGFGPEVVEDVEVTTEPVEGFTGFTSDEQEEIFGNCHRKENALFYMANYMEKYGHRIKIKRVEGISKKKKVHRPRVKFVKVRKKIRAAPRNKLAAGKKKEDKDRFLLKDVNSWVPPGKVPPPAEVEQELYQVGMLPPCWVNEYEHSPHGWNMDDIVSKATPSRCPPTFETLAPFELSKLMNSHRFQTQMMKFTINELSRQRTESIESAKNVEIAREKEFQMPNAKCQQCGTSAIMTPPTPSFVCHNCFRHRVSRNRGQLFANPVPQFRPMSPLKGSFTTLPAFPDTISVTKLLTPGWDPTPRRRPRKTVSFPYLLPQLPPIEVIDL